MTVIFFLLPIVLSTTGWALNVINSIIWQHIKVHSYCIGIFYLAQYVTVHFSKLSHMSLKSNKLPSKSAGNFQHSKVLWSENPFCHSSRQHGLHEFVWSGKFLCCILYCLTCNWNSSFSPQMHINILILGNILACDQRQIFSGSLHLSASAFVAPPSYVHFCNAALQLFIF